MSWAPSVQRHGRARAWPARLLLAATMLTLLYGWHRTWPDLNRDFNHHHGWGACQEAHLARGFAEEGLLRLGFGPIVTKFFDSGGHYLYYTHYPILPHVLLSLMFHVVSPANEHRTIRLAGMIVTMLFLLGLYLLAFELYGEWFAAWALFFAAVNAENFYFGAFYPTLYLPIVLQAFAYWSYLRWKRHRSASALIGCALFLLAGYCSSFFFYFASLPIAADLLWCYPAATRRQKILAGVLVASPLFFFSAIQLYNKYGIALLTGREVYGTGSAENLARRTQYELLLSFDFYKQLIDGCLWYVSPPAFIGAAAYFVTRAASLTSHGCLGSMGRRWKGLLIGTTSFIAVLLFFTFPGNVLDHEFMYMYVLIPMALAAAVMASTMRSWAASALIIVPTVLSAFAGTVPLKRMNNTPEWEFRTGVALRLFTPADSFVRVDLDANYYFTLLYYAHRNLLFNVPERFQPVDVNPRFEVAFRPLPSSGECALIVPGVNEVVIDRAPKLRPELHPIRSAYANGAYEILAAGITGTYERMHVVEVEWRRLSNADALDIDVGELVRGEFVRLGRFRSSATCVQQAGDSGGPRYRDAYFVQAPDDKGPIVLRVFNPTSGDYSINDAGRIDIYLEE